MEKKNNIELIIDKNKKKIFEGDIIKRHWSSWLGTQEVLYCVKHDETIAMFVAEVPDKQFTTFDSDGEAFEIVGNIYNNPQSSII